MTRRPDLIVPIRDRRAHKRILTLKNARKAALVVIIFIAGVTISSHFGRKESGQYGRLFDKQMPVGPATMPAQPMAVVHEAPAVATIPDPLLAAPAATTDSAPQPEPAVAEAPRLQPSGDRVTIVGDTAGVNIVRGNAQGERPLLRGGIFRDSQ